MMKDSIRVKTTMSLYLNYLVHGMAIVILAQNMTALGHQWKVPDAGVAMVISSLGIGRLLVLYISGFLSDRIGRKFFVQLGILTYIPFFIGIIFSGTTTQAYFWGILAGMANSFLDSGTYPALMELFPKSQATANILIKAFASIGELILPLLVAGLEQDQLWYGWSFVICAVILSINFIYLSFREFPQVTTGDDKLPQAKYVASNVESAYHSKPITKRIMLGIILTLFGYISMATFYLISQWLTKYGEVVSHLGMVHARFLVSLYSIGSIIGVLLMAIIVDRVVSSLWVMIGDTVVSLVALVLMASIPQELVMNTCSFIIGVSAAGGVMQIGLTVMSVMFPAAKGTVTGIYYTASGLASFSIPLVTGIISKRSIHSIMWFDVLIAIVGVACTVSVAIFSRQLNIEYKVP